MTRVEIRLGSGWEGRARALAGLRPSADRVEPGVIEGELDLVLDGDNVTAHIEGERVFPVMSALLNALVGLIVEGRGKAIVQFTESPWELMLAAQSPTDLGLSLYGLAPGSPVILHNRTVISSSFSAALIEATERLCEALEGIHQGYAAGSWVRSARRHAALLRGAAPRLGVLAPLEPSPPRWEERLGRSAGATVRVRLDLGHWDLVSYDSEVEFDWHALLCAGEVEVGAGGARGPWATRYPLRGLRDLVVGLREAVGQLCGRGGRSPGRGRLVTLSPLTVGGADLATPWRLDLHPPIEHLPRIGERRAGHAPLTLEISPGSLIRATLEAAEGTLEALLGANPLLEHNERFQDLVHQTRELALWYEDATRGDIVLTHDEVEAFEARAAGVELESAGDAEPRAQAEEAEFRFPLVQVRRLGLRERWAAAGVLLGTIQVLGDHALVVRRGAVASLALGDGATRWEIQADASSVLELGDAVVIQREPGNVEVRCGRTGDLQWSTELGGLGAVARGLAYRRGRERWWILAGRSGEMAGVEAASGSLLWRRPAEFGALVGALGRGALAVLVEEDGVALGLNAITGESLWRVRIGAGRAEHALLWGDVLVAITSDRIADESDIVAIDGRSGEVLWRAVAPGRLLEPPQQSRDRLVLCQEYAGSVLISSIDLRDSGRLAWVRELDGLGASVRTWDGGPQSAPPQVFVRADDLRVLALDAATGQERWSTALAEQGELALRSMPLFLAAGALVAPAAEVCVLDLEQGRVLHRLAGLVRHPDWLHVTRDMTFLVGETTDTDEGDLRCYGVEHWLAVVK